MGSQPCHPRPFVSLRGLPMENLTFPFSDTIAGYVTGYEAALDRFDLRTTDGRLFTVGLTPTTQAELVRNLGEPYQDATGDLRRDAAAGPVPLRLRHLLPRGRRRTRSTPSTWSSSAATRPTTVSRAGPGGSSRSGSWPTSTCRASSRDGTIDFTNYRTDLTVSGNKIASTGRRPTRSPGWSTALPPPT